MWRSLFLIGGYYIVSKIAKNYVTKKAIKGAIDDIVADPKRREFFQSYYKKRMEEIKKEEQDKITA